MGAALLLTLAACNPAKPTAPAAKEPAAATVNGTPISQKMVDLIAKRGVAAGRPDTPEARATIIDQLALQVVLADEAIKKGLDKSPEVVEQIEAIKQSVLANAYVEDFIKTNPVSDADVQAAYDRIKATITGNEYKARHILVEKESEAKDIIAKLKKDPANFEKLAKERSLDQGSKDRGGDLGWLDPNRMAQEFSAALEPTGKGQVHRRAGQDRVRLSRDPARRRQADRGAAPRRREGAAHAADSAAEREEAAGDAEGSGKNRSGRRGRSRRNCACTRINELKSAFQLSHAWLPRSDSQMPPNTSPSAAA